MDRNGTNAHSRGKPRSQFHAFGYIEVFVLSSILLAILQLELTPPILRVLVMGMDYAVAPGGQIIYKGVSGQRSDAMMLVEVNRRSGRVTIWQIPRDTLVHISDDVGWDKINSSVSYVGAPKTCEVVGRLMGCKIHHYVVLTIPDFERLFDIVHSDDPSPAHQRNLEFGAGKPADFLPRVPGASAWAHNALFYVQHRSESDFSRQENQRDFVRRFVAERPRLSPSRVLRLALWARGVDMDISLLQAGYYAWLISRSDPEFGSIPCIGAYLNTFSYVLPLKTTSSAPMDKP